MIRRQLPVWSPLGLSAVASAAGAVLGGGPGAGALEARIAQDWSMDSVLLTDSGTGALTLALRAARAASPGRPVAMPAWACFDLATAADGADVPVVLYDLEPATLAPEPESLRSAVAGGVAAVVVVHFFGLPVDIPSLRASLPAGTLVIEDAAQSAGGRWQGRRLGGFGDVAVLSFGRGKGITAGKGGALLANAGSATVVDSARDRVGPAETGSREIVQLAAQWLLASPWLYAIPASLPFLHLGETIYHAPAPVRGMSAAARAALPAALARADGEAEGRRSRARALLASVAEGLQPMQVLPGAEPGYLRLPLIATHAARLAALTPEARASGIMPGYPIALCDLAGFRERCRNAGAGFPGARRIAESLITLPTHGRLGAGDLRQLGRWLTQRKAA